MTSNSMLLAIATVGVVGTAYFVMSITLSASALMRAITSDNVSLDSPPGFVKLLIILKS